MANDMQWPSEDEDFDAKTDSEKIKSFSNQPEKLVAKPVNKPVNKVSVAVSEPDNYQSEAASEEIEQAFSKPVEPRDQAEEAEEPSTSTEAPEAPEAVVSDQQEQEQEAPIESEPAKPDEEQISKPGLYPVTAKAPKDNKVTTRTILEAVMVLTLIALGVYAFGLQSKNQDLNSKVDSLNSKVATLNADPQILIKKQTDDLIAKVGTLMDLPKGESPTVANVTDAEAAKKQSAFFNSAQNGDKVLMYVKAGQAILYRPSTGKIVLVAPLTFNADAAKPAATTPAVRR